MKSLINLSHLKFFCDAVSYSSISEAAKMNYVSQSAVSQAINKIELQLGAKLLVHSRQKFQVTEIGKIVYEQGVKIFKHLDDIDDQIHQKKKIIEGTLKFVSTKSLGISFIPSLYKKMEEKFPHIKLSFQLGGRNYIRNALRQHEAEFAIVVYDKDFFQFSSHPLKKGQFNLYQHVEASDNAIEQGVFVDYFQGSFVQDLQEHFQQMNLPQIKLKAELSGWNTVARFTELNLGVGFFPDYLLHDNCYKSIKLCPVEIPSSFEYQICAIHNKEYPLSTAARTFLELFKMS